MKIYLSLLLLPLVVTLVDAFIHPITPSIQKKSRLHNNFYCIKMSFTDDITFVKTKVLSKIGLPLAFYALMLSPIYGIGLPSFLGSMTDFTTLTNRGPPSQVSNEYIVTPRDFTPARINSASPVYDVPYSELEKAFDRIALRQPRTIAIDQDEATHRREYVQRAFLLRWPDVITFQAIPLEDNKSTFAIHSYSIFGAGDLGVNGKRVNDWIYELKDELKTLKKI